jgi:mono/diheme cytochrome c family protein
MLFPLAALADDAGNGEEIFNRKCSQCHTFAMAKAMLEPVQESERPAHLRTFLETHPPKLNESEKAAVIRALSRK